MTKPKFSPRLGATKNGSFRGSFGTYRDNHRRRRIDFRLDQLAALERLSQSNEVTISRLVREIVDHHLETVEFEVENEASR